MAEAEALRALVGGDLAGWTGLPAGTTRPEVERALGTVPESEGPLSLFGTAAVLCRYPATPAAPLGVVVWYVSDEAALVELHEPVFGGSVEALLGPPEATVPSLLGSSRTQLVYASRGLAAHVSDFTDLPYRIYGFEACPLDQFLDGPLRSLASVRIDRSRRS